MLPAASIRTAIHQQRTPASDSPSRPRDELRRRRRVVPPRSEQTRCAHSSRAARGGSTEGIPRCAVSKVASKGSSPPLLVVVVVDVTSLGLIESENRWALVKFVYSDVMCAAVSPVCRDGIVARRGVLSNIEPWNTRLALVLALWITVQCRMMAEGKFFFYYLLEKFFFLPFTR